ncbi:MAG: LysM peptidoglycan-binding domain-containing protein [Marmoricola sp.]
MKMPGLSATFDHLLVATAVAALGAAVLWTLVVLLAVLVEQVSAGRWRWAPFLGCPTGWHRWLLALVAALVTTSVTAPHAVAADHAATPAAVPGDGLPIPDRTTGGPVVGNREPGSRALSAPTVSAWMTVRRGDSLWSIGRRLLPPGASAARTATASRVVYELNRSTIGQHPDLILPGQHLALPTTADDHREDS